MTAAAWSALVTGLGGALALALFWIDAKVPGFSELPVTVRAVGDRGAGTDATTP
jgi:hypothetical protein